MKSNKTKRLRRRLSEAQNHRCAYCGKQFGSKYYDRCTIEHYQAKSHGGRTNFDNTVVACCRCNQQRGNAHPMKFWLTKNPQGQGIAA
jgi:5-methylcytosine-specific restriction endonuclease McrA